MAGNLFDLNATLRLDKSSFESGVASAGASMEHFSTGMIAKGTIIAHAIEEVFRKSVQAIAGFVGSAIQTGADFDKSMSQVAATLGLSMNEMMNTTGSTMLKFGDRTVEFSGNLRDFAQVMGENTKFTAKEAADALNYMALAGYNTQESMEMLPTVLNMAAAGNMDLAKASDMVTDTQKAYGLSFERTTKLTDEMAKAASTGNTSVEQLGEAFLRLGGLGREVNGGMVKLADGTEVAVDGVTDLSIAFTAMANSGVKGSEAGTKMRNMITKLSKPTKQGALALQEMNVQIFDAEGKMRPLVSIFGDLNKAMSKMTQEQKIKTVSSLFNARDLASAQAVLNAIEQDWDKIGSSIIKAEGAANKMANTQLDNLAGDITIFKSALDGTKIALSDGVTPALRGFVKEGTKGLGQLTEKIKKTDFSKLGTALEKLGHTFANMLTGAVDAIANFVGFVGDNFDKIINLVVTLGNTFLTLKIASVITSTTGTVLKLVEAFQLALGGAGTLTEAFSAVGLSISPIAIGLTAVIGGIVLLVDNMHTLTGATKEEYEASQKLNAEIDARVEAWNRSRDAAIEHAKTVDLNTNYYKSLVTQLENCYDANGKLKEGQEEHAKLIASELKDAYGIEIDVLNNDVEARKKVIETLKEEMRMKQALNKLMAYDEDVKKAQQDRKESTNELKTAIDELRVCEERYNQQFPQGIENIGEMNQAQAEALAQYTEKKKRVDELTKVIQESDLLIMASNSATTALEKGNYEAVIDTLNDYEENVKNLPPVVVGANGEILASFDSTSVLVTASQGETYNTLNNIVREGMGNMGSIIHASNQGIVGEIDTTGKNLGNSIHSTSQGIVGDVKNTSNDVNTTTQNGVRDVKDILNGGLDETQLMVRKKAAETGEEFHEIPKHADILGEMVRIGENVVKGFIEGFQRLIDGAIQMVSNAFSSIGKMVAGIFDEHSPSKVFMKIGGYVAEGFGIGFQDDFDDVKKDIANDMKSIMDLGNDDIQLGNISYSSAHNANALQSNANSKLESMMGEFLNKLDNVGNQQIVLDTGVLVGQTVNKMDSALGSLAYRNARGVLA